MTIICLPLLSQTKEWWKDVNNEYINAHGGGVLFHNGLYYWFGEHRPENGFTTEVGVNCYASSDLQNWTHKGVALAPYPKNPVAILNVVASWNALK